MLPWLDSEVIGGNSTVSRDSVGVEMFRKQQNVLAPSRLGHLLLSENIIENNIKPFSYYSDWLSHYNHSRRNNFSSSHQ